MGEKDDGLALSLSLKCPQNHPPTAAAASGAATGFPLNLLPSPSPSPFTLVQRHHLLQSQVQNHQKLSFMVNHDLNTEARSYARGIDVNRPPSTSTATAAAAERDDEVFVSSPNSTVSSVSGKRAEREENEAERDSSSHGISGEEEDDGGDAAARKKLRLSKDQAAVLEETFKEHNTLNPKQKLALAKQLDLRPRQVEVWFQNRRARTKLKQTEVDCEYLKRCCETLTEENRRLQKEVNELRSLKLSPQFYMNMSPPTTLTMCPQCERVAVSSSSSTTSAATLHHAQAAGPDNQKSNNHPFLPRATVIPQHPRW